MILMILPILSLCQNKALIRIKIKQISHEILTFNGVFICVSVSDLLILCIYLCKSSVRCLELKSVSGFIEGTFGVAARSGGCN